MNYIHHMNNWFAKVQADDRLYPSHISLYFTLFQQWNINRFNNPISICREETMKWSRIGSRTTYLKCLHDLTEYGYIEYIPSRNPMRGSKVNMINFCTSTEQVVGHNMTKKWTSAGHVVGSSINNSKQYKTNNINSHVNQNKNYDEPL